MHQTPRISELEQLLWEAQAERYEKDADPRRPHQQQQQQQEQPNIEWTPVKKAKPHTDRDQGAGVAQTHSSMEEHEEEEQRGLPTTKPDVRVAHTSAAPDHTFAAVGDLEQGTGRHLGGGTTSRSLLSGWQSNAPDDAGAGAGGSRAADDGLSSISDGASLQGVEDVASVDSAGLNSDGFSDTGRSTSTAPSSSGGWAALPPTWVPPVYGGTSPLAAAERAEEGGSSAGSLSSFGTAGDGGGGGGGGMGSGGGGMAHAISRNAIRMGGNNSWSARGQSQRRSAARGQSQAPTTLPFGDGSNGQIDEARRLATARKPGAGAGQQRY